MEWDLEQLEALFKNMDDLVVTREKECLLIANQDGLDAWLAISGEQIIVESLLFNASQVADKAALDTIFCQLTCFSHSQQWPYPTLMERNTTPHLAR